MFTRNDDVDRASMDHVGGDASDDRACCGDRRPPARPSGRARSTARTVPCTTRAMSTTALSRASRSSWSAHCDDRPAAVRARLSMLPLRYDRSRRPRVVTTTGRTDRVRCDVRRRRTASAGRPSRTRCVRRSGRSPEVRPPGTRVTRTAELRRAPHRSHTRLMCFSMSAKIVRHPAAVSPVPAWPRVPCVRDRRGWCLPVRGSARRLIHRLL